MYSLHLITVIALFNVWSASLACANDPVKIINDALNARPFQSDRTIPTYVKVAEDFLESKSKSNGLSQLFNHQANMIKLLQQFIEVGKSVLRKDCSDHSLEMMDSLPINRSKDYSAWGIAIDVFHEEYNKICSAKLRDSEKHFYESLDQNQLAKVKQLAEITIPIIRLNKFFSEAHTFLPAAIKSAAADPKYFDELENNGSAKFKEELLMHLRRESGSSDKGSHLPEVFSQLVDEPCRYYTDATSNIFERQINRYKGLGLEDMEFYYHFFEYQLCRFLEKKRPQLLKLLQAD